MKKQKTREILFKEVMKGKLITESYGEVIEDFARLFFRFRSGRL